MHGEISADELDALLERGTDVRIVDVRSSAAFRRGHIPGSENVPLQELTGRIEEFGGDDRVVTVCPHGEASVQAARLIASYEDFSGTVESLECGVDGWPYDLESDSETAVDEGPDAPF